MLTPSLKTIIKGNDEADSDTSESDVEAIIENYEGSLKDWTYETYECHKDSEVSWSDGYFRYSYGCVSWTNGRRSWTHSWTQAHPISNAENPRRNGGNNEEDTITRLGELKKELEGKAWDKLQTALKISTETTVSKDLSTCIERAIHFLNHEGIGHTPRGAADAVKLARRALGMCKLRTELREVLGAAVNAVQDVLSVRTQLESLPLGNRTKYYSVLQHAWVEKIDDTENSRLTQSYQKSICEKFPGAFPSNNRRQNIRRGGPRKRRDRKGRSCPSPPHAAPPQAETAAMVFRPPPGLPQPAAPPQEETAAMVTRPPPGLEFNWQ